MVIASTFAKTITFSLHSCHVSISEPAVLSIASVLLNSRLSYNTIKGSIIAVILCWSSTNNPDYFPCTRCLFTPHISNSFNYNVLNGCTEKLTHLLVGKQGNLSTTSQTSGHSCWIHFCQPLLFFSIISFIVVWFLAFRLFWYSVCSWRTASSYSPSEISTSSSSLSRHTLLKVALFHFFGYVQLCSPFGNF